VSTNVTAINIPHKTTIASTDVSTNVTAIYNPHWTAITPTISATHLTAHCPAIVDPV
jgi:hypothetical protein